jgi:hypothetical protein
MSRALALLPLLAVACVPPYKPPTLDQPHAVLKLRRSYDTIAGSTLEEAVDIEEHRALRQSAPSRMAQSARMDALLIHPVPSTVDVNAHFFHIETHLVHESYQVSHTTYDYETYDCSSGFGATRSFRTCSRTVPHTHYETRYRDVWRQVPVTDGVCGSSFRLAPRDGHVYLMQYTYHDQSVCSLSCYEQVPEEGGTFKNLPCVAAPPAD